MRLIMVFTGLLFYSSYSFAQSIYDYENILGTVYSFQYKTLKVNNNRFNIKNIHDDSNKALQFYDITLPQQFYLHKHFNINSAKMCFDSETHMHCFE